MHRTLTPALATLLAAAALEAEAPVGSALRVSEAPVIDGRLDDAEWAGAPILSDFVQREPIEGRPVSERTEIRILYDDDALYVGAWMYVEDPSNIVLGQTRRDAPLENTDAFTMVFDTYLDRQNGFVSGTTPAWAAGTETPGVDSGEYGFNVGTRYETRDWRISGTYR